jgi:uncharacterized protein (TIGR02145 family)
MFTSCKKDASNPVNTDTIPVPPTLASPTDTSSNIAVPVVLTWKESSGAKSYTLQVSASSSFSSFVFNKSDITTTTQQVPDLNYLAVYYWRVSATNSAGTSDWSKVWSFTTTGEAALVPQLSLPANGAVDQKLSPILTWNQVSNASRYTLQISTNSSFTSFVFDEDSLTTTTKQINDLSGSTKYYWRISAVNNFGTKGWSETWSFTTGVAPVPPVLLSPSDAATDISLSPTLSWNASSGATSYILQVSTSNSFSSFVFNQSFTTTNKQITGLTNSTKYYWRVSTTNSFGTSNPTVVWSFTTGTPPEIPTLSSPQNGAIDISSSPMLVWNASIRATNYTLQVSTNISFSSFVYNQSGLTNTSNQLASLTKSTKYFWRVSTTNNYGTSNFSDVWNFTTGSLPNPPTLLTPTDGATDVSLTPTLSWNASSGATSYTLQVSMSNSFSSFVINQSGLTTTSTQITGLIKLSKYFWRVIAVNSFGNSAESSIWLFTTLGSCVGTPIVTYEGKTYHTVQIGNQCWLKENLDVGTMIQVTTNANNNGTIEKYCFYDNPANCSTYGGLYQWNEAMQYSITPGTKGICPNGWHIPIQAEFETLKAAVNNNSNALKSIGQGIWEGTGTNTSGFSALIAGFRNINGNFNSLNDYAYFWASTEYSATNVYSIELHTNDINVEFYNLDKGYGFSVRCLKD